MLECLAVTAAQLLQVEAEIEQIELHDSFMADIESQHGT
jgi:hypothetical protein